MTDKDSSFAYSNIISLNIRNGNSGFSVKISPNPVDAISSVVIYFNSKENKHLVLKIISANGRVMSTKHVAIPVGSTNINLPELKNYSCGVYTLSVLTSETKQSPNIVRFVIQ